MKYIAAYRLAKLGGKENPTVEDIKTIIESTGIEFEKQKAEEIVDKLREKDLDEVIENGKSKLSVVSDGQTQNETQQKQSKDEKANTEKEEETLEIGGGFDDIFDNKYLSTFRIKLDSLLRIYSDSSYSNQIRLITSEAKSTLFL